MDIYGGENILLAPLAGITDKYMRQLAAEQGAGFTFTEMISAKGTIYRNAQTHKLLEKSPAEKKFGVQLFGREPAIMAEAVKMIEDSCGDDIALFDVNMGCPVPKVVNNKEGSALMREPMRAAAIVRAMKKATNKPITVKIRLGMGENTAVRFAVFMEEAGADAITVHGRLREQYYSGKADWDTIGEVKNAVSIHVNANGDVFRPEDAKAILEHTGADGVMVARGALGNPFLFRQIAEYFASGEYRPVSLAERASMAIRHAKLVVEGEGEYYGIKEMRKHGAWYIKGMKGAASARDRIVRAATLDEFCDIMKHIAE